jgi:hypothetical protein
MRDPSVPIDPVAPHSRPPARRHALTRASAVALLGLALSACGTATFSAHDLRLSPSGDTLYVFARSPHVSRTFCSSLGGDVARTEGRLAAADTRGMRLGRVTGCYTARHIIVCAEDDAACVAHEERHRDRGDFHQ